MFNRLKVFLKKIFCRHEYVHWDTVVERKFTLYLVDAEELLCVKCCKIKTRIK